MLDSWTSHLASVFFVVAILGAIVSRWNGPLSALPGPWFSRWTGLVLGYHWLKGNKARYVHRLHEQHGPVVRLSPCEVDICDISAVKDINRIGSGFIKTRFYKDITRHDIEVLFNTSDVKYHADRRRLLSSPMSDASLRGLEPLIDARVCLATQKMREEMNSRGVVDVFKWWTFMAADITGELCFGDSFRMLEIGKKTQYIHDLESVSAMEAWQACFPTLIHLASMATLPMFSESVQLGSRIMAHGQESVLRYKRMMATDPNPKPTIFTNLFDPDKGGLSDRQIVEESASFIVAGGDTTAYTLTYLVWAVCQDDHVKATLVQELASLPENFHDSDIRSLTYIHQVINEALRLYSAVPAGLPRVSPKGTTLAGYWIPAEVTVTTQAYSLHRDPHIFPDPERFDPSRWEEPTTAMKEALVPFGGGTRICIGMHLARIELRLGIARFFRSFPRAAVSTLENMSAADMVQMSSFLSSPSGKRCLVEV